MNRNGMELEIKNKRIIIVIFSPIRLTKNPKNNKQNCKLKSSILVWEINKINKMRKKTKENKE